MSPLNQTEESVTSAAGTVVNHHSWIAEGW